MAGHAIPEGHRRLRTTRLPTLRLVDKTPSHIGTLREKPLHASLKQWYSRPGDLFEMPLDGYVVDLLRDDGLLIEIQTSGFSSMKAKTTRLLATGHRVRIVHPIPVDKTIVKVDSDGTIISRRISPKHGAPTDVFGELVSFPGLLAGSDLELDVVMTIEEEYRHHTPDRSWRRRGWSVTERRLIDVKGSVLLTSPADLVRLLPDGLPAKFTTADIAEHLGRPRRVAQQMAYCLREIGAIDIVGKQGNTMEYRLATRRVNEPVDPPRPSAVQDT